MNRIDILMTGISKTDKLIEIGPSINPLAPKAYGWNSMSIDHADQATLRDKYRYDSTINLEKIEQVNFVWKQGSLCDAVPIEYHNTFDIFLASHVIEHHPNLIDFLESAHKLTAPSGHMILAIPDKRTCFDMYRSLSSTGEAIQAHLEKRSRHTVATVFDFNSKAVVKNGLPGWLMTDTHQPTFLTLNIEVVQAQCLAAQSEYIDAHAWIFCPASFELIMVELARLGYTDWKIDRIEPTPSTEFFAWLSKGGKAHYQAMGVQAFEAVRMSLLNKTLLELAEQNQTVGEPNVNPQTKSDSKDQALIDSLRQEVSDIKSSKLWRLRAAVRRFSGL